MSNPDDDIFVIRLCELLDEGKSEEAEKIFYQGEANGNTAKSLWEIVPAIASRLTSKKKSDEVECFDACERMLEAVAKNCNAKEAILLLVEQIEYTRDEHKFRSILKTIGVCILRLEPSRVIDWCMRSIKNYTLNVPCPPNEKPSAAGENNLSSDEKSIERIICDYGAILDFLEPIVQLCALPSSQEKLRNHLLALHHSLFGSPFCYLSPSSKDFPIAGAFDRALAQMGKMSGNLLKNHGIIDDKSYGRKRSMVCEDEENDGNSLRGEQNVSDLAWANFYYCLLNSREGLENIPQIYDYRYLMQGIFYLANVFLTQPEYNLVRKGLRTIDAVIARINVHSVTHEFWERSIHKNLFDGLARVMIYCDSDEDRKIALKVFENLMEIWDYRGRYLIITSLYETANHSGILSLLTSITRKSIIRCLDEGWNYFLGKSLDRLVKRICRLPNGACSDLVEISDEIIAALNLVRFLIIRDRDGTIGISRIIDYLTTDYLKPLREGIDMSRPHWRVKIKDLEEEMKKNGDGIVQNKEITISVGGQNLPNVPISEKIQFCHQAINALDVMESILVRVNECIKENYSKKIGKVQSDSALEKNETEINLSPR